MKKILNIIKNSKLKNVCLLLFLLFIYVSISAYSYVNAVSSDLSNGVFRLHVIANSDTDEDQNLKYIVRDNLLNYMNTICKNCTTKQEAISLVNENKENFYDIAKQTITNLGYDYDVKINIGNFYFPTKNYGDISLPAGDYDALRVEIGEAKGKNWWCVMFPSLCFIDVSSGIVDNESKGLLEDNLSSESYNIISDNKEGEFKIKFKLIELFSNRGIFTAKK